MKDALKALMIHGSHKSYKKRAYIIKAGAISNKVYYLKSGVVRHFVITRQGEEKTIRISQENDFFFSSIVSFFKREPSYIYCQCLTNVELVYWHSETLDELYEKNPELNEFRILKLTNFILEKHNKEIDLLTKSAFERFEAFCREHAKLFNRIPHHVIASYLDVTPETLSRMRSKLLKS